MGYRRRELRLTGKDLFVFYHKRLGLADKSIEPGGCTNKRVLSNKTGIEYNTLMWVFTRQGLCYYENDDTVIMKLYTGNITKGGQSVARKGKGGMERFIERYVIKKRDDY